TGLYGCGRLYPVATLRHRTRRSVAHCGCGVVSTRDRFDSGIHPVASRPPSRSDPRATGVMFRQAQTEYGALTSAREASDTILATGVSPWNYKRVKDTVPEGRYKVYACRAAPLGLVLDAYGSH